MGKKNCLWGCLLTVINLTLLYSLYDDLIAMEAQQRICFCFKVLRLPSELSMSAEQASELSVPIASPISYGLLVLVASPDKKTFEYGLVQAFSEEQKAYVIHKCRTHKDELSQCKDLRIFNVIMQSKIQHHLPREQLTQIFKDWEQKEGDAVVPPLFKFLMISPTAKLIVIGDIHGDSKGLRHILYGLFLKQLSNALGILNQNVYVVFTGDLADRGPYGPDVWALILQFKKLNPDKVFVLRGNHESLAVAQKADFFKQMRDNTSLGVNSVIKLMNQLFASLPLGLIVCKAPQLMAGNPQSPYRFLFLCHAGFDRDVDLNAYFRYIVKEHKRTGVLDNSSFLVNHSWPESSGFLWTDFGSNRCEPEPAVIATSVRGRDMFIYNSSAVTEFFKKHVSTIQDCPYSFDALVRGHQHAPGVTVLQQVSPRFEQDWKMLPASVAEVVKAGAIYTCTGSTKWTNPACPELAAYGEITFDEHSQQWLIKPEYLLHAHQVK